MAATMDISTPAAAQQNELMRRFMGFLDSDNGRGTYHTRIQQMVSPPDQETLNLDEFPKRLIVSLDELRDYDPDLTKDLQTRPVELLPVFEKAMHDIIMGIRQDLASDKRKLSDYRIGLDGSFGYREVSPRGLTATLVGGVVQLTGIVTRASVVRPRLVLSVHYCPATKKFHEKTYRDNASVSSLAIFTQNAGMPGGSYPTKDEDGNPLETEFGRCWYRDSQRITVQELPENSPPGQLPRSVDVLIEGDLCDVCKPGDRVSISGIFRAVGGAMATSGSGIFSTFVVANNIMLLTGAEGRTAVDSSVHEEDIRNFLTYARKGKVLERMSKSIAPSICGHDFIKRALLLLLIGGRERNLDNGTHLRGDLNILMVGDPSTAKSQLLRFIMNTAPMAVSTTGRGSSGVGLTAAVTTDQETGDRHLEAGAMVLADRGVVCIDEFDKMSDEDRVALHEVMEQQTVTIAKAGIHASLNARCSVVAAANPIYGSYDQRRKPNENIALPDSLLSRFDLLFIVLDIADKQRDWMISGHVLRMHQFRATTDTLAERDEARRSRSMGASAGQSSQNDEEGGTAMYDGAASALYQAMNLANGSGGRRRSARQARKNEDSILSTKFLKLYISYAKHRVKPTLTREAAELIAKAYQTLRQDDDSKTQHITPRCLETLIRLATSHAKLRLDKTHVVREDAAAAVEVLRYALFNQAEPDKEEAVYKRRSRRGRQKAGEKTVDDDDDDDDGDNGAAATASRRMATEETDDVLPETEEANAGEETAGSASRRRRSLRQGATRLPASEEAAGGSAMDVDGDNAIEEDVITPSVPMDSGAGGGGEDVERVKGALNKLRGREGMVAVEDVVRELREGDGAVTEVRVQAALEELQIQEVIVVADGSIFIV